MKQEAYPRTLKGNKARKRAEAVERQSAWANLSPKQQLAELDRRPGESKKQRARILALMGSK
jgi:hypothetical protein